MNINDEKRRRRPKPHDERVQRYYKYNFKQIPNKTITHYTEQRPITSPLPAPTTLTPIPVPPKPITPPPPKPRPIPIIKQPLDLHDVLKSSYQDRNHQAVTMMRKGYVRDKKLSNHNEQVYYNPDNKKLLYNIAGTHNLKDWGTDVALATGHLKDTSRYKEAKQVLEKAKDKYKPTGVNVTGHSLGGTIANYVAGKNDKVYGYNSGFTLGQKTRPNATNYRTSGDVVSLIAPSQVKTLENKNSTSINPVTNIIKSHNVSNLKGSGLYF